MTLRRVAVISDVHGNAPALAAVLDEIAGLDVDLIVSCGDLVAGPLPNETVALVAPLGDRVRYVRGNADREVMTVADGGTTEFDGPRHAGTVLEPAGRALLDTFAPTVLMRWTLSISASGAAKSSACSGPMARARRRPS